MSQADIDQLARWRTLGARHSEQVINIAPRVLASGKAGDNEWAIREQLAIALLDMGQINLATKELAALKKQFTKSPRVVLLVGMILEAHGETEKAKATYQGLLQLDSTNISAHQRLISMALGQPHEAISQLLAYLDIYYSDAQAWSLLASLYADEGAYSQSLTALGHLQALQTWDSQAVLRAGETAYTMGDFQLALKYFLRAAEMETPPSGEPDGHRSRAWWGVKLCVKHLLVPPSSDQTKASVTDTAVPTKDLTSKKQLLKLDLLATERVLAVSGQNIAERRQVLGTQA